MKLGEKIQYCRKKAGMSQDALAEKIGVSRQAISKWELGDAVPEISNLASLAKTFGVTVDWLISEEDVPETDAQNVKEDLAQKYETFFDTKFKWAGRLIKKYGWLCGVYLALCGLGVSFIGLMAKAAVSFMFGSVESNISSSVMDQFGNVTYTDAFDPFGTADVFSSLAKNNPVSIMANFFIAIGVILIIGGIVLAVYLRKKGKE